MLSLDLLWLGGVASKFYREHLAGIMRASPNLWAAGLFYCVYLVGVNEFVIWALPRETAWLQVALRGALFGFVAYSTFDLTAQAMIEGWPWRVTAVDLLWGTCLTALVSVVGHRL
jgi:uncharacterized membrane protein